MCPGCSQGALVARTEIQPGRHLHRPEALGSSEPVCRLDTALLSARAGSRLHRPVYQLRRCTSRGCVELAAGVAAAWGEPRLSLKAVISERKKRSTFFFFFFVGAEYRRNWALATECGEQGLFCTDQILFQPSGHCRLLAASDSPWPRPGVTRKQHKGSRGPGVLLGRLK